jgi:hypothetical protein
VSLVASKRVWGLALGGSVKLVLLAIADHANEHFAAWPGVESLARMSGVSTRRVQEILRVLEGSGHLEIRTSQGPRGTNLFIMRFPKLEGVEEVRGEKGEVRTDGGPDAVGLTGGEAGCTGLGVKQGSPGGAVEFTGGVKPSVGGGEIQRRQSSPEPSGTVRNRQGDNKRIGGEVVDGVKEAGGRDGEETGGTPVLLSEPPVKVTWDMARGWWASMVKHGADYSEEHAREAWLFHHSRRNEAGDWCAGEKRFPLLDPRAAFESQMQVVKRWGNSGAKKNPPARDWHRATAPAARGDTRTTNVSTATAAKFFRERQGFQVSEVNPLLESGGEES